MSFTTSALLVSWAAIAALGLALAGVLARLHRLEEVVAGRTPAGVAATRVDAAGSRLAGLLGPDTRLVLLGDRGCAPCETAAAAVTGLVTDGVGVVVWRDEHPEVFVELGVATTPYAVLLDEHRRLVRSTPVGSPERLAETLDDVEAMVTVP